MKTRKVVITILLLFFSSYAILLRFLQNAENTNPMSCLQNVGNNSKRFPAESCDQIKKNSIQKISIDLDSIANKNPTDSNQPNTIPNADDRRTLVDLSNEKQALLDSVALISTSTTASWEESGWGSGFLVSKCHILTAHHVVFQHEKRNTKDQSVILIPEETPKLNKPVSVGLGQTNSAPWKLKRINGKVVGFDEETKVPKLNSDELQFNRGRDWALIKIDKDSTGSYPTQDKKSLCLNKIEAPLRIKDVMKMGISAVGHPGNKFENTKKLSLWQDTKCKIAGKSGDAWVTTCQLRPGMSGGPIATYLDSEKCWMPLGVISANSSITNGFTKIEETDFDKLNDVSPLSQRTRELIQKVMEQSPCD